MYTCEICKKEHPTISERNACEAKCLAKQKAEEEQAKKQALADVKEARRKEIENEISSLNHKISEFVDDYGDFNSEVKFSRGFVNPFPEIIFPLSTRRLFDVFGF